MPKRREKGVALAYNERTVCSETVYEGKIFNIRRDTVEAVNGRSSYRDILEHSGAAVVLAVTEEGKIALVRQWRQALRRVMLELPAGKIDEGESFVETALRELKEETGYRAGRIEHLLTIAPSAGYSEELLAVYLCRDLEAGGTDFDETEDLDLIEYEADALVESVLAGEIQDAKTVAAVLFARAKGLI